MHQSLTDVTRMCIDRIQVVTTKMFRFYRRRRRYVQMDHIISETCLLVRARRKCRVHCTAFFMRFLKNDYISIKYSRSLCWDWQSCLHLISTYLQVD